LRGVIDSAANIADNDAIEYGNLQEVLAYESRGMWFDVAKTIGGELPFVDKILEWNDKIPGDPLHQIFVGDAPVGADPTYIAQQSSEMMQYAVAQRLIDANLGDPSVFQQFGLIDPETNQLRPIKQDDFGDFRSAFTDYFMGINPTVKIGIEDYEDAYRDALPTPTGHTGG
jgi:hypothetical protein